MRQRIATKYGGFVYARYLGSNAENELPAVTTAKMNKITKYQIGILATGLAFSYLAFPRTNSGGSHSHNYLVAVLVILYSIRLMFSISVDAQKNKFPWLLFVAVGATMTMIHFGPSPEAGFMGIQSIGIVTAMRFAFLENVKAATLSNSDNKQSTSSPDTTKRTTH